jgi:glucosamine kinase
LSYYLGIDGGGTKTTCAVGDESRVLAKATSGPSNIVRVGEARARESLHECVRQACAAAGITPRQISYTCAGGSGAGRAERAAIVQNILAELLVTPVEVVGDMHIAVEAAFGSGPGVIVIAGTGSIAYGRDAAGKLARAGGWGFAVGDEGSAHWIGRAAVSAVLRAADESGSAQSFGTRSQASHSPEPQQSPLTSALLEAWNSSTVADLAHAANSIPPPDFASLFPAILASGDEQSMKILTEAGMELARLAAIVTSRLFPKQMPGPVPVAMIGGVFRHAKVVREIFYNEVRRLDVRAEINPEVVEPVEGALRLARSEGRVDFAARGR